MLWIYGIGYEYNKDRCKYIDFVPYLTGEMDILLPVFQLLYFVAHFLVSLALSVLDTFRDLHHLLLHVYLSFTPTQSPNYRLQADAAQLKKVPQHLGLLCLGRQVHNVAHLVKIVSWAVGYGVHYVSLYDAHGKLKQKRSDVLKALQEINCDVNFKLISHDQDCHQVRDFVCGKGLKMANGVLHQTVTVNLLNQVDGRGNLANIARKLSLKGGKINSDVIDSHLLTVEQPEPDMIVTIGEPTTMLGFLPWQIRLSELYSTPSLSRFEYNDFQSMLQQYSKCQQRFGK